MGRRKRKAVNKNFARHKAKTIKPKALPPEPTTLRAYGEAVQLSMSGAYEIPDGLTVGKAFKTLGLGQVSSRMSGEAIGQEIDREMLEEMVRLFVERQESDPVIIDWNHATSPYQSGIAPPETGSALGLIIDLELKEDGLYATPAYNEKGLDVVNSSGGVLWSSPEFLIGGVYDRLGGSKIGEAQLLAVTLTPRPAQSHDQIERVTLSEESQKMDNIESMNLDELRELLIAKNEMVKNLEETIKQMQQENEASLKESTDEEEEKAEKLEEKSEEYKLSEQASPVMLSEIQALNEKLTAQSAEIQALKNERDSVKCDRAVEVLLSQGKVSPAEVETVKEAYKIRETQPAFWAMFSSRAAGFSVPLNEIGHGASGQEINKQTLNEAVHKLKEEKNISFSEALSMFRAENPSYYTSAFGG